ncbi:AIM24 family protein [Stenotrophomonas forensis]|uniref:AIM24 family protein n=1 Tax=Stenotrophomonas forensis TaxID=2871169 RepID=UPI0036D55A6F
MVSGFGSVYSIDAEPGKDIIIDNAHVVAWDSNLNYSISATSLRSGLLSGLVSSVTSGEGLVLKFNGQGKVVLCSCNCDRYV